jgi:hypothetical protein
MPLAKVVHLGEPFRRPMGRKCAPRASLFEVKALSDRVWVGTSNSG